MMHQEWVKNKVIFPKTGLTGGTGWLKSVDITDYLFILAFYLLLQLIMCSVLVIFIQLDPLRAFDANIVVTDERIDVVTYFNALSIIIKNFPLYLLVSFGFPIVVFLITIRRTVLPNLKSLVNGLAKLIFGELLALVFVLLFGSYTASSGRHLSNGNPGFPTAVDLATAYVRTHIPEILSILDDMVFWYALFSVISLVFLFRRILIKQNEQLTFQASAIAENLAHQYIKSQIPTLQKLLMEYPNGSLEDLVKKVIERNIGQFKALCDAESISFRSKKLAAEYCFNISESLRSKMVNHLIASLDTIYQGSNGTMHLNEEKLPKYCSKCGQENLAGSTFCSGCGEALF
ncbi:MAG: zinc ribbon domain-containing protein [Promethearchaeota archaeon]